MLSLMFLRAVDLGPICGFAAGSPEEAASWLEKTGDRNPDTVLILEDWGRWTNKLRLSNSD
jgi:hypothetical protein